MLSYLIVIIRPKKLENGLQTDKKNWLTWRYTDRHKKKGKNLKNQHSLTNAGPQIEYHYYPLNVEGVTQNFSLFPAHIR